jgi:hypothetical protein
MTTVNMATRPSRKYGWTGGEPEKQNESTSQQSRDQRDQRPFGKMVREIQEARDKRTHELKEARDKRDHSSDRPTVWTGPGIWIPRAKTPDRGTPEERAWLLKDHQLGNTHVPDSPSPLPDRLGSTGSLGEGKFNNATWQKRKPARSAWVERATKALDETGARSACPGETSKCPFGRRHILVA